MSQIGKYVCVTNGFTKKGFYLQGPDKEETVMVIKGDLAEVDERGYLWRSGICICHRDSILGKYHFRKVQ